MTNIESLDNSNNPEVDSSIKQNQVKQDINELLEDFATSCPECNEEMTLEVVRDYCLSCLEKKVKQPVFELTEPEDDRTYISKVSYSFLVHEPLGDVEKRYSEIGEDIDRVLMASLVNQGRQGTFCGEGGLILSSPTAEAVKGMSSVDCGGEIASDRHDSLEDMKTPAERTEYNQIDMKWDGVKVVGVMLKVNPKGEELGNKNRNEELRKIAEKNDLSIIKVEASYTKIPDKVSRREVDFGGGKNIATLDIPYSDDQFLRVDIAHGQFYHSEGDTVARSQSIDCYGQVNQKLTEDQRQQIIDQLSQLVKTGTIYEKDLKAVEAGFQ